MARSSLGFTLIELLVVVVVAGVLLTLAAPGFRDFILTQRLKSVHAQLLTDLQFARSEAASRGQAVNVRVQVPAAAAPDSCYILFTDTAAPLSNACDCRQPEGSRCPAGGTAREVRTVRVPASGGVVLSMRAGQADHFAYNPVNGSIQTALSNLARGNEFEIDASVDTARRLRVLISPAGRPAACAPAGSVMGAAAC